MYTKYLSLDLSNAKSKENPFGMMMVLHALSSDVVGVYWFQYSKQKIQIYLGSHVFTFFHAQKIDELSSPEQLCHCPTIVFL